MGYGEAEVLGTYVQLATGDVQSDLVVGAFIASK